MFTQCCYIRKNTAELRNKLKEFNGIHEMSETLRLTFSFRNGYGDCIVHCKSGETTEPLGMLPPSDNPDYIDCGTNEKLFLALAALRDDTDENQWFVLDTNVSMASENFKPKGTFIRCDRKSWFRDPDKFEKPILSTFVNIPAHKASVQELINHFKK